jgi:hypothetical protein
MDSLLIIFYFLPYEFADIFTSTLGMFALVEAQIRMEENRKTLNTDQPWELKTNRGIVR